MDRFWIGGFEGTSTADLVEATGLSRSSLYGAYGSKHGLFVRTLDAYLEHVVPAMLADLEAEEASLEAVDRFFGQFATVARDEPGRAMLGCYCVTASTELAGTDPDVAERSERYRQRLQRAFGHALAGAVRRGEVAEARDVEAAAALLTTIAIGLFASLRMGATVGEVEATVRSVRARSRG